MERLTAGRNRGPHLTTRSQSQLYTTSGPVTTEEINAAAAVINWLPGGVRADVTKVSVSGHSRGGKVAFALALGRN